MRPRLFYLGFTGESLMQAVGLEAIRRTSKTPKKI